MPEIFTQPGPLRARRIISDLVASWCRYLKSLSTLWPGFGRLCGYLWVCQAQWHLDTPYHSFPTKNSRLLGLANF